MSEKIELKSFEKVQRIGKGGFGDVYMCQHPIFKKCVMKEVYVGSSTNEEVKKISKEAGILSLLKHPNIVQYLWHDVINPSLYIVMEFAPEGDLHRYISNMNEPPDEKRVIQMLSQVVCGVSYIHEKEIVHRDICAMNVLLCKGGVLKLSDFGLSRMLQSMSNSGAKGNPCNFSPELCWGSKATKASDMWAVGCLLYHMCTRERPFLGSSLGVTVKLIVNGPPPRLPDSFSQGLRRLLQQLLHKSPSSRPSAAQLLAHPLLAITIHADLPRLYHMPSPKKVLADLGFNLTM